MSLADEARTLRERVALRLAELEPLVREYEELQRVAAEIGLVPAAPASPEAGESRAAPGIPEAGESRTAPASPHAAKSGAAPASPEAGESRIAPTAGEGDQQRPAADEQLIGGVEKRPAAEEQRMGGDKKRRAGGPRRTSRGAPRRRQPRRGSSRPSAAAERDARVLEAVATHPGATVAEIASVLGVDAVSLYRPVRDLASAGKLVKRGRGLFGASD